MFAVRLNWLGGEDDFALRIGELRALQTSCDAGPEQIFGRVSSDGWRFDDIFETLRLGLIGGGAVPDAARARVAQLFEAHPLVGFKITAQAVLLHALIGDKDDPVGEPAAAET